MAAKKAAQIMVQETPDGRYKTNAPDTPFREVTVELKYGGNESQFFVSCNYIKDGFVQSYTARGLLDRKVRLPETAIAVLKKAKTSRNVKDEKGRRVVKQVQKYIVS